jgi:DNA-binding transcriptional MerR regulator
MEGVADVSTGQAAAELGISIRTLQFWAKRGWIKPAGKTPGGRYRWDVDDLRRQLRDNLQQAEPHNNHAESRTSHAGEGRRGVEGSDRNDAAAPTALRRRNTPGTGAS